MNKIYFGHLLLHLQPVHCIIIVSCGSIHCWPLMWLINTHTYFNGSEHALLPLIQLQLLPGSQTKAELLVEPNLTLQLLPVHSKVGGASGASNVPDDHEVVQVSVEYFVVRQP